MPQQYGRPTVARLKMLATALGLASATILVHTSPFAAPVAAQPEPPVRYRDIVFDRVERQLDLTYGSAIDIPSAGGHHTRHRGYRCAIPLR